MRSASEPGEGKGRRCLEIKGRKVVFGAENKVLRPEHCWISDQYLQIINNVLNWSLTIGNMRIHCENRIKNVGNLQ